MGVVRTWWTSIPDRVHASSMNVAGLEYEVYNGRRPTTVELLAIERETFPPLLQLLLNSCRKDLVTQKPVNNVNPHANCNQICLRFMTIGVCRRRLSIGPCRGKNKFISRRTSAQVLLKIKKLFFQSFHKVKERVVHLLKLEYRVSL